MDQSLSFVEFVAINILCLTITYIGKIILIWTYCCLKLKDVLHIDSLFKTTDIKIITLDFGLRDN